MTSVRPRASLTNLFYSCRLTEETAEDPQPGSGYLGVQSQGEEEKQGGGCQQVLGLWAALAMPADALGLLSKPIR